MKITYFGNFDTYYKTEVYITDALRSLGHDVTCIPGKGIKATPPYAKKLIRSKSRFMLFGKTKNRDVKHLIRRLHGKVLTVSWQHDLYDIPPRPGFPPEFDCDLVFSTDGGKAQRLRANGITHHVLRQGIHAPDTADAPKFVDKFQTPIAFVGHSGGKFQPDRATLISTLQNTWGKKFKVVNNFRGKRLNQFVQTAGIVVGDSYPAPNYWSNRIYEILGRGGFLLHPKTTGLDTEFTDGEHYVSYPRGDFDQLNFLIKKYLEDHAEREEIRRRGFEHVRDNFTYTHRCEELINIVTAHRR